MALSETPEPTVDQLARDARAGSLAAYSELVRRLQRPLFDFLRVTTASAADAEELAQAALVRAWDQLDRYQAGRSFTAWLFTIARHEAVSQHRRRRRRPDAPLPADLAAPDPDPARILGDAEQQGNLWDLAARVLDRDQLTALWLRYAEDLSAREIGAVLGRRPASVRVLLHRARRVMARHLQPRPDARAPVLDPDLLPRQLRGGA